MSFTGEMPLVGASRFGVRACNTQGIKQNTISTQKDAYAPPPVNAYAAAPIANIAPPNFYNGILVGNTVLSCGLLSATKKPLNIGDYVRGSNCSRNEVVNKNFRGEILEFIPPTSDGNNVRVRCNVTKKVYRVKNTEIRHVV